MPDPNLDELEQRLKSELRFQPLVGRDTVLWLIEQAREAERLRTALGTPAPERYHTSDGDPCSLEQLVREEPDWACAHIRSLRRDVAAGLQFARHSTDLDAALDSLSLPTDPEALRAEAERLRQRVEELEAMDAQAEVLADHQLKLNEERARLASERWHDISLSLRYAGQLDRAEKTLSEALFSFQQEREEWKERERTILADSQVNANWRRSLESVLRSLSLPTDDPDKLRAEVEHLRKAAAVLRSSDHSSPLRWFESDARDEWLADDAARKEKP